MKKSIFLIFIICFVFQYFLSSCKKVFVTDEILSKQQPYNYKVKSSKTILKNGLLELVAKNVGGGTNYFFKNDFSVEFFLFITCDLDCNEFIDKMEWNEKNNSFAVLIKSKYKTNFETKNRLIVYKISNNQPIELLDTVKEVYKIFRFEKDKFIYVLESGVEKSIDLN